MWPGFVHLGPARLEVNLNSRFFCNRNCGLDGAFEFDVGKHVGTGELKLTCKEPYFFDEGNYAPADQLECKQKVSLIVEQYDNLQDASRLLKGGQPWVLDICLDYFSVNNPFSAEFKKLVSVPNSTCVLHSKPNEGW